MVSPRNDRDRGDQLVKECLSGSEEAWNEFYRQYDSLIRVVARRHGYGFSGHSEDDMVQTVYLKLVKSLHTYDPRQLPLKAFVGMVAKRACIDYLRHSGSMSRSAPTNPVDHHGEGEDGTVNPVSHMEPPDRQVEQAQQLGIVSLAMSRLKAACKELIKLRFHLDLPYAEIAAMFGKKEHTVNVQTIRCLAELKANYDQIVREGLGQ
jgi:RNA polymerase sigma factor (sigma-70 family)